MNEVILKTHLASSWFMTGLIWLVQIVHYKLFNVVGAEKFIQYHQLHSNLISFIVMPVMLIELFSLLALFFSDTDISKFDFLILGISLFIIWATTALFSVAAHNSLANGFNEVAYQKLVSTNWIRTIFWTLKSIYLFKLF